MSYTYEEFSTAITFASTFRRITDKIHNSGLLKYKGTLYPREKSPNYVYGSVATSTSEKAFFMCGNGVTGSTGYREVYVITYDKLLTYSSSYAVGNGTDSACATFMDKAIMAGGLSGTLYYNTAYSFTNSLSRTSLPNLSTAKSGVELGVIGNYMICGGGGNATTNYNIGEVYSSTFTKLSSITLNSTGKNMSSAYINNKLIYAGGKSSLGNLVTAIDSSLITTTLAPLSEIKYKMKSVVVGDYVIFAGGYTNEGYTATKAEIYDKNLIKITSNLSIKKAEHDSTTIGNLGVFVGGTGSSEVITVDSNLVKRVDSHLTSTASQVACTSIGKYVLCYGGIGHGQMDIYQHCY